MRQDIANESMKSAPAVAVTVGAWFAGMTLDRAVLWATLVYVVLQAGYLVWRWIREIRKARRGK